MEKKLACLNLKSSNAIGKGRCDVEMLESFNHVGTVLTATKLNYSIRNSELKYWKWTHKYSEVQLLTVFICFVLAVLYCRIE